MVGTQQHGNLDRIPHREMSRLHQSPFLGIEGLPSSGHNPPGFSARKGTSSKTSQTPSERGRGKKFLTPLSSFSATGGRCIGAALADLAGFQGRELDDEVLRSGYLVPFHLCLGNL